MALLKREGGRETSLKLSRLGGSCIIRTRTSPLLGFDLSFFSLNRLKMDLVISRCNRKVDFLSFSTCFIFAEGLETDLAVRRT